MRMDYKSHHVLLSAIGWPTREPPTLMEQKFPQSFSQGLDLHSWLLPFNDRPNININLGHWPNAHGLILPSCPACQVSIDWWVSGWSWSTMEELQIPHAGHRQRFNSEELKILASHGRCLQQLHPEAA